MLCSTLSTAVCHSDSSNVDKVNIQAQSSRSQESRGVVSVCRRAVCGELSTFNRFWRRGFGSVGTVGSDQSHRFPTPGPRP